MPIAVPLVAAGIGAAGSAYAANQANKGQKQAAQASQAATDLATAEQRRQYDLSRADNAPWLQAGGGALAQLSRLYGLNGQQTTQAPQPVQQFGGQAQAAGGYQQPTGGGFHGQQMIMADGQPQVLPQQGAPQTQPGMAPGQPPQGAAGAPGQYDTFWQSPDYNFRQSEQARALTARNAALGIQDSGAAQRSAMQYSGNLASSEYGNYANRLSALAGVGQTAAGQNQQLGQNYAGAVGNLALNNADNLASSYQNRAAINGQFGQQFAGIGTGFLGRMF